MLAYDYSAGSARLDDLPEIPISPHLYVLCDRCATSLRAPRGWVLDDRRGRTPEQSRPAGSKPALAGLAASTEIVETPEIEEAAVAALEPAGQRQLVFGYSA